MSRYLPVQHRPTVPNNPTCHDTGFYKFARVAWYVYWTWVERSAQRNRCSLSEARRKVHRKGRLPARIDDGPPYWHTNDYLVQFMLQFEEWQTVSYDLDALHAADLCRSTWESMTGTDTATVDGFLEALSHGQREDLLSFFTATERWDLVRSMLDDPIYGAEAAFELTSKEWSDNFEAQEKKRRAALPDNVKRIDRLIRRLGPSNYSVLYPYPPNQYHQVPNCLCVLADGGPIFRLEVLDPEQVTQFRLAELMPPWWSLYGAIGESPSPGEGEYDFPFPDFEIDEGDTFDLRRLLEVMQAGAEQIATRGTRKYGR